MMKNLKNYLVSVLICFSFCVHAQIGVPSQLDVPGTLNQVKPDPEVETFQKEYRELGETVDELDEGPVEEKKPNKNESKLKPTDKKGK